MRRFLSPQRGCLSLTASAAVLALAMIATPAAAQTADQAPQDAAAPQDDQPAAAEGTIVVTGSRIARPEFDTVQPTQVVGAAQIESRGYTNVGQALHGVELRARDARAGHD